jgi:hypothetical protein
MDENTRTCFRCNDLAVIDKAVLVYLPGILNRSAELLGSLLTYEDINEVTNLKAALRQYAILLGGLPDGN